MAKNKEAMVKIISQDLDVERIEFIEIDYGSIRIHWKETGVQEITVPEDVDQVDSRGHVHGYVVR